MRASFAVAALPALCTAQQIPFLDQIKTWMGAASSSISSAIPLPSDFSIPNPVAEGAKKYATAKLDRVTLNNYQTLLQPGAATASPGIEEWLIFVTGGNKSCYGLCGPAEQAWYEAVPLIQVSRSPPNLGILDCETDGVLCNAWAADRPQLLQFLLPQPRVDQSTPATTVRYIHVNRTTVTAPELAAVHLQEKYKETEPYEGFFHPFDGSLAKFGLAIPYGYALWGLGKIPSWAMMIGISMISRSFMGRRMQPGGGATGSAPAGQPAPAAAR